MQLKIYRKAHFGYSALDSLLPVTLSINPNIIFALLISNNIYTDIINISGDCV